jgi:hypothetical protein
MIVLFNFICNQTPSILQNSLHLFTPVFSEVRVAQSYLIFCIVFCGPLFVFYLYCPFVPILLYILL